MFFFQETEGQIVGVHCRRPKSNTTIQSIPWRGGDGALAKARYCVALVGRSLARHAGVALALSWFASSALSSLAENVLIFFFWALDARFLRYASARLTRGADSCTSARWVRCCL